MESLSLSAVFPASAREVYEAWLSSKEHTAFTGSQAVIDPRIGGKFAAWEGYIQGTTVELEPYRRILQDWRTTDFPKEAPDSKLEIIFEDTAEGAKITLNHTDIPGGQSNEYREGWIDYYFETMAIYFNKKKNR